MKIFNRGTDTKAPAPAPAAKATPGDPSAQGAAVAPPTIAPPVAPPAPATPDLTVILDANVREMSEKIARLASNLESSQQERTGFEAKIEQMEERMRKLSSLTEMISAQYNPFVGDAPTEREAMPRPEIGLAPPPSPAPPEAALALALDTPPAEPSPVFSGMPTMAAMEPALPAPLRVENAETSEKDGDGVYLWHIAPGFEPSMLLLGWADMLLTSAGSRESMLALVNYYHNIGWIGDPARDQLLAYADGLTPPAAASERDWRANVEVHEKSLLFVEKLRAVGRRSA